jgi:hypothetical protein
MREKINQSVSAGAGSNVYQAANGSVNITNFNYHVPEWLVDNEINRKVDQLVKCRFYTEYDLRIVALQLSRSVFEGGNLAGGSDAARSLALAWCARILAHSHDLDRAEECVELAKTINDSPEVKIAEAFIASGKGDKVVALQILASIHSGASHAASLIINVHHDGAESALKWMNRVCRTAYHLDSDGKGCLLNNQLQLGYWDAAAQTVASLSSDDFERTPTLHHFAGLASLIQAVPPEFRSTILIHVPLDARNFRLASIASAMEARQTAHKHFLDGAAAARELSCSFAAETDDEYALWLELLDPNMSSCGLSRLNDKLSNPETRLRYVRYGIQFGLKPDTGAIEREIEKSVAINCGKIGIDAALARFALIQAMPSAEEAANYIERHQSQLVAHIEAKQIRRIQIELLIHAGLIEKAKEGLAQLIEDGIDAQQQSQLQRAILDASAVDTVEPFKDQFEATGSLVDLILLVGELEAHNRWGEHCEYARLLFNKTDSLIDAERLANSLIRLHRSADLVEFLRSNEDLISQSKSLQSLYAWGLYYEGDFTGSRAAQEGLSDEVSNQSYRLLLVNLAIATGDWASLTSFIASESQERDSRSAYELLSAGKLALNLDLPQAKNLVFEAAAKAGDDSAILADAYFTAISAGWEEDSRVVGWLEQAGRLSDDDGPLKRMTLKELHDRKPEWDQRETEIWNLLAQAKLPIFLAAQSLNRTLIDLTIFPALTNSAETDPRMRKAIPAYSGRRIPCPFDMERKAVGLEATALLTLGFLNLLDVAFDAFEAIHIPHSTLAWLFMERQRAVFHQPSRIENARTVRNCLATNKLEIFSPTASADVQLTVQVGKELASFIAEAENARDRANTQHIVVRPAPVYRVSSLMEEEADLSEHAPVLSSCLAVVEKLRQRGTITANEEKKARAYLNLQECSWPNQPAIADGATIYLDDLAISYFLDLKMLGKLKDAGLTVVVSPSEVSEGDALLSYESISDDSRIVIERIRSALSSRIDKGIVRVGCMLASGKIDQQTIHGHPSVSILDLAGKCDALIIDDRFHNQHSCINADDKNTAILTSLDLLDALVAAGTISNDDRIEHRTRLRRAGYVIISIDQDELEACLLESPVIDGRVVETAELKAIRESFLSVRMSGILQLPQEAAWLEGALRAIVHVLKGLWVDVPDFSDIIVRSNWLAGFIDIRGWAHCLAPDSVDYVIQSGPTAVVEMLLSPPADDTQTVFDAYWKWLEECFLEPFQEQFPEQYGQIVDSHRRFISEMTDRHFLEDIDA